GGGAALQARPAGGAAGRSRGWAAVAHRDGAGAAISRRTEGTAAVHHDGSTLARGGRLLLGGGARRRLLLDGARRQLAPPRRRGHEPAAARVRRNRRPVSRWGQFFFFQEFIAVCHLNSRAEGLYKIEELRQHRRKLLRTTDITPPVAHERELPPDTHKIEEPATRYSQPFGTCL
ncbi:unnamed protein product, partial [Urochloa humidicola]